MWGNDLLGCVQKPAHWEDVGKDNFGTDNYNYNDDNDVNDDNLFPRRGAATLAPTRPSTFPALARVCRAPRASM